MSETFPPPEQLAAQANVGPEAYDEADADRLAFWEKQAEPADLDPGVGQVLDWIEPPVRQVVRRRQAQRRLQLRRPARRGRPRRPGRLLLGGRAGRHPDDHLRRAQGRGLQGRQRADRARRPGRRPGRDLHADDPRDGHRDAGVRAASAPPHTVVFGGFSADALASRIDDCDAVLVITSDGGYRRGAPSALKPAVDDAVGRRPRRPQRARGHAAPARTSSGPRAATSGGTTSSSGSPPSTTPESFDAEHPLYIMYTSGTTASPRASCTPPAAT